MEVRPAIQELDGDLIVFYNAAPELIGRWFERSDLPRDLRVASDPDASLYDAIGTTRQAWAPLLAHGVVTGLKALRAGFVAKATNADMQRLGADVVVDASGEVRFLHLAKETDDRTSPERLLNELEAAAG